MKKLILLTLSLFIFGCGDNNNSSSSSSSTATTPASSLTATPSSYDFGSVNVGETKTATFTINSDGYIISANSISTDFYGLDITNVKTAINEMYQNKTVSSTFTLSFTPMCIGSLSGELNIYTDRTGNANIDIPLTATITEDQASSLPYCSGDNPKVSYTSTPDNAIKQGEIQGNGNNYYINFADLSGNNHVVITSTSNTIIGPVFSTTIQDDFTVQVTPWTFENNQVTSVADITFNSTECSGPASERFQVYGINGTANGVYLYVFGEGTAASGPACSNKYQLATP